MKRFPLSALIACVALASGSLALKADMPGRHPAYLHALVDLRHARANVERRGGDLMVKWDEKVVIHEIDEAIREIKEAAIEDGKNLEDHPPIDVRMDYAGRLHRALELLHKADRDCHEEEDNGFAHGLLKRATHHIGEAIRFTEQAMDNARR